MAAPEVDRQWTPTETDRQTDAWQWLVTGVISDSGDTCSPLDGDDVTTPRHRTPYCYTRVVNATVVSLMVLWKHKLKNRSDVKVNVCVIIMKEWIRTP